MDNPDSLVNQIKSKNNELSIEQKASVRENEDVSSTSSDRSNRESEIFESLKEASGAWGIHRFEKHPWSDYCRPCVKLEKYDEDEESGLLTDSIISSSLSYLERSPYDLKYVLCKCMLSHKKLTDINALTYYHYIQYLDLSWNNLTTLAPLGQLPFLQHLNASHNNIELLLDFKAPFYLGFVNFSHNSIETIPDLTEFWSIHHLDVSNNNIKKISGLQNLRYLQVLNLSHNKITTLENLENLRIQFLKLHHNAIDDTNNLIMNLKELHYLRSVDLSNNKLSSLRIFENAENLENINVCTNNISMLLELYYLQNLRYLSKLNLSDNPVTEANFYINVCLRLIKSVIVLDGKEISAETRTETKDNCEIDPKLKAGESHIEFVLLQQINHPSIGPHIIPYDQPPPMVLILVGPPGSRKGAMVQSICYQIKKCVAGISHTTRTKMDVEVHGKDYYFISREEFKDLTRKGLFIAVSEFNGHSYGITYEEIRKCQEGILVFQSDLNSALSLRLTGLNPKLVLAMPRYEHIHMNFLRNKYYYTDVEQGIGGIVNSSFNEAKTSISRMDSITELSRSTIEDIVQNVVDLKDYEELLKDDTISTELLHTVTPVHFSDENVEITDVRHPTDSTDLCSILKRGPSVRDTPRVSFLNPRYSSMSDKCESASGRSSTQSDGNSRYGSVNDPSDIIDANFKSISEHMIHSDAFSRHTLAHILSVLSSSHLPRKSNDETHYITAAQIFDLVQDPSLLDKLDSASSVRSSAVSYTSDNDTSYKSISDLPDIDINYRSVSEDLRHSRQFALLSALSCLQLHRKSEQETLYIRPSDILNIIRDEKLTAFFKNIIDSRAVYLDLHWSNPGLFREVIFTNEEEASLEKIKALIKFSFESYKSTKLRIPLKDHPSHQRIIKSKITNLDLQESPRYDVNWEEVCTLDENPKRRH